jgi:hypothetical protein
LTEGSFDLLCGHRQEGAEVAHLGFVGGHRGAFGGHRCAHVHNGGDL